MTTAVPDDFCRRIDLLRDEVRLLLRVAQGGLARRAYLRMEYGLKPKKRRFTLRKYENRPFRAKKQILGNSVFTKSTIRPILGLPKDAVSPRSPHSCPTSSLKVLWEAMDKVSGSRWMTAKGITCSGDDT